MDDRRPTVQECRRVFSEASTDDLPDLISRFSDDERAGVMRALAQVRRRLEAAQREAARLDGMDHLEQGLRSRGFVVIAGVDEVGRGALAGPVTAAAVVLTEGTRIDGLDDSKHLRPSQRERLAESIRALAMAYGVTHVDAHEIDRLGIANATMKAMRAALEALDITVDHVLVDGKEARLGMPSTAVIGGDAKVAAIAAASILAKVTRDALMVELHERFPVYGFAAHKGYGTVEHFEALHQHGPSPVHRSSFAPCRTSPTLF